MTLLHEHVRWFDDWYAVEAVRPWLHAIGEPKYHQINWNYLIVGSERALLFDTGPGIRDIAPVVASLTDLPVTVLPSHLHYDHTGNLHRFADIAMGDLPILRACERDGVFQALDDLYLGHLEDMVWTPVRVSRWWPAGHRIDLGGRTLEVLATPGHSPDSLSLHDAEAQILLAADFLYRGDLYAQVPGSSLSDYLDTARRLADRLPAETLILGAHGMPDADGRHEAPKLSIGDLNDLVRALEQLRGSSDRAGNEPLSWPVNARMGLLAGRNAFGGWRSD